MFEHCKIKGRKCAHCAISNYPTPCTIWCGKVKEQISTLIELIEKYRDGKLLRKQIDKQTYELIRGLNERNDNTDIN